MLIVLDACAMIAYLRGEQGAKVVETALTSDKCIVHAANLAELYKDCLSRGEAIATADMLINDLLGTGLEVRVDMDEAFWKGLAICKNRYKVAFGDCFAICLAERLNGSVMTSDKEFLQVKAHNSGLVTFIR